MNKQLAPQSNKKMLSGKIVPIIGFGILGLGILWVIITVIIPLARGNGIDKYSGTQKQLAETIVDLTRLYNGPQGTSFVPDSMFNVRVDEIYPVTKEEITEFCKDATYITENPDDPHFYTVVITEQYLLSLSAKQTTYVGCNHTDYIYTQAFGYPAGRDPRVQPY